MCFQLVFILLFNSGCLLSTATQITCQTSVDSSKNIGKIMCKYPQDLNQTKQSFCLIQYESSGKSDVVIACTWLGERSLCSLDKGYRLLQTISDVVAIEIPAPEETLMYACDTVPPNRDVEVEQCKITPEGGFLKYTSTTAPCKPCLNSSDIHSPKNNHTCDSHIGIHIGITFLVTFVLTVASSGFLGFKCGQRTSRRNTDHGSGSSSQLQGEVTPSLETVHTDLEPVILYERDGNENSFCDIGAFASTRKV